MRRPVEEMTDRELLEELVKEKRLQETLRRIRIGIGAAIAVAVAILLAIYLPPVIRYFRQLNETIQQVRRVAEQAGASLDSVRAAAEQVTASLDGMRQEIVSIESSGAAALQNAAERLNELLNSFPAWFH